MAKIIVDTNVAVVANQRDTHASEACILASVRQLQAFLNNSLILVIDQQWYVLREYMRELHSTGQPGVGDAFLKWVLTNQNNPHRCERVSINLKPAHEDETEFIEFPDDPRLHGFDRADRKFVAISRAHSDRPPIANATDTDWRDYAAVLAEYGINVEFLCPTEME